MSISSRNRRGSNNWPPRKAIVLIGGGLLAVLTMIVGGSYCWSPYLVTNAAVARLADKTLSATVSEGELQAMSSNLYAALDQVIPGAPRDRPESILAQVGGAVVREVRGQLLAEASRRLASREGIDLAIYGWQGIADRRVSVQRQYLEFPRLFSVVMIDAADGTTLTELVFVRSGFSDWSLAAVRPHWMRRQGTVILRQIIQAGVQKVTHLDRGVSKPIP